MKSTSANHELHHETICAVQDFLCSKHHYRGCNPMSLRWDAEVRTDADDCRLLSDSRSGGTRCFFESDFDVSGPGTHWN